MRKLNIVSMIGILLLTAGFLSAAGTGEEKDSGLQPNAVSIAATTSIVGNVVSAVAGDTVQLTILMSRGQNPHSYQPSPKDAGVLERADLIFVNGFGLEEDLLDILERGDSTQMVSVSDGILPLDGKNPHVWFSPLNVMVWVENIRTALVELDPENADSYNRNARHYLDSLEALDAEIREDISTIPSNQRKLVMDHDSMTYFANDYGFEISGLFLPGFSDQSEPSSRDIAALANQVKSGSIQAIFIGETAGTGLRKLVDAVAAESGQEIAVVELLSGSLAASGLRGDNYIDYIRYNTELIVEALKP